MSACAPLPDDPTELALLIQDDTVRDDVKNCALNTLNQSVIQPLARKLSPDEEFSAEALSFVWIKLAHEKKFDPNKGSFNSWCQVILRNRYKDFRRRTRRLPNLAEEEEDAIPDSSDSDCAYGEELQRRIRELREELDHLASVFRAPQQVDYFAVLLLQLRLVMARMLRLHDLLSESSLGPPSDLIAWALPWRPGEASRSIRPVWASLGEVWEALREELDRPPYCIEAPGLCDILSRHTDGKALITADVWNQWVRRAKQQARSRVDPETWEQVFARFLPDHSPRSRDGGAA